MKKGIFVSIILVGIVLGVQAQSEPREVFLERGVKSHSGIDDIYRTFSDGYRKLKPELVANLYTEDAAYLSPGSEVTNGRSEILEGFARMFKSLESRNLTAEISFRILQRKVEKKMGYDVGIYTLKYFKDGKEVNISKGKFVAVAVKGKDKKWRFQVDGYSDIKPQDNN